MRDRFDKKITAFLEKAFHERGFQMSRADENECFRLLALSLGRVLRNESLKADAFADASFEDAKVDHVVDWIAAAVINREDWIANVDAEGRPRKLMKFGSLDQMVTEADKAVREMVSRGAVSVGDEAGTEVVAEMENGYRLVRLVTPEALDRDSERMQHCVGGGSYDAGVVDGSRRMYSLRDRLGSPHVTVDVDMRNKSVREISGKQNRAPRQDYLEMVGPLLPYPLRPHQIPNGFVQDRHGYLVKLADIAPGSVFDGDLVHSDFWQVPEGVTVTGNLTVVDRRIEVGLAAMPKGVTAAGGLRFEKCAVDLCALPDVKAELSQCSVFCDGDTVLAEIVLDRCDLGLMRIVEGVTFRRHATIDTDGRMSVKNDARFEGGLTVKRGDVEFDDGFVMDGDFRAISSAVKFDGSALFRGDAAFEGEGVAFPDGAPEQKGVRTGTGIVFSDALRVEGDLSMSGVVVPSLPETLDVSGSLTLKDGWFGREFPEDSRIGGAICVTGCLSLRTMPLGDVHGDLVLEDNPSLELVGGMRVRGDLRYAGPSALPRGLTVDGNLVIGDSRRTSNSWWLPKELTVGGTLDLRRCHVSRLPADARVHSLDISGRSDFHLPDGIEIPGSLVCVRSNVEALPEGLRVGNLNAANSGLRELGEDFTATGDVNLNGCNLLDSLPEAMSVGGRSSFLGTGIAVVPASVTFVGETAFEPHVRVGNGRRGARRAAGL